MSIWFLVFIHTHLLYLVFRNDLSLIGETSVSVEPMVKELEEFVVPYGFIDQKDLNDKDDVDPQNKFTATEKLNIALAMAESLADLHGFKDGMIIHDDVQLCQWLWDKNGKLRLGDFNRAELSLWSEKDQKYCKHYNGMGWGNVSLMSVILILSSKSFLIITLPGIFMLMLSLLIL